MIIILSSGIRKRYRDDFLRCLSAPNGAEIQFRYSQKLVDRNLIEDFDSLAQKEAIACFVDLSKVSAVCPVTPLRKVFIEKARLHGTTMSLLVRTGPFVDADKTDFTNEIAERAGDLFPIKDNEDGYAKPSRGYLVFEVQGPVNTCRYDTSIKVWENLVESLYKHEKFKQERFFWSVLGIVDTNDLITMDIDEITDWPVTLKSDHNYTLLIYVYHPDKDSWDRIGGKLEVDTSDAVREFSPIDMVVDSPYDLKRWNFRVASKNIQFNEYGWIRIHHIESIGQGQKTEQLKQGPDRDDNDLVGNWEISLPFKIALPRKRFAITLTLLALFLSLPNIVNSLKNDLSTLNSLTNNQLPPNSLTNVQLALQIGLPILLHLVSGIVAAVIAIFGIKKID